MFSKLILKVAGSGGMCWVCQELVPYASYKAGFCDVACYLITE